MGGEVWRASRRLATVLLAGASLAACATIQPKYAAGTAPVPQGQGVRKVGKPYQVRGVWYQPAEDPTYDRRGVASWYGDAFHMKPTANGEIFDMNAVTAAHTTLPLPSMVEVTNLDNGRKLMVRVNDRGPFIDSRIIDLSHEAARELGFDRAGLANVRVRYVGPAPLDLDGSRRMASNSPPSGAAKIPKLPTDRLNPGELAGNGPATGPFTPPASTPPSQVAQLPPAVSPVTVQPLAPPTELAQAGPAAPSSSSSAAQAMRDAAQPLASSALAEPGVGLPAGGYRIQVGAFSDPLNARRAVSQLAQAGPATIEPVTQDGTTLYRVLMDAPVDEGEAFTFRDTLARFGFSDARVVRAAGL